MKIKNGFELRDICGEKAIIAQGVENINFNRIITLNESAEFLWKHIADGHDFTTQELVDLLMGEYDDANADVVRKDVKNLLADWQEQGLIEP
jgi:hypothetical protein